MNGILPFFDDLTDPRAERTKLHSLKDNINPYLYVVF